MTDAPEEIWVNVDDNEDGLVPMETSPSDIGKYFNADLAVKYIRADLVPQWQPIETAPKDGSYILMYGQDVGFAVHPSPRYPSQVWGGVTHWQPIPQPPE